MMCEGTAMGERSVYDVDAPRLVRALGRRATEVNLNLVWDYPVFWSRYKVLRDLIQNFYDAVEPAEWHRRFRVHVEGDALHLRADATGVSYEWLLHIGASTKRDRHPGLWRRADSPWPRRPASRAPHLSGMYRARQHIFTTSSRSNPAWLQ